MKWRLDFASLAIFACCGFAGCGLAAYETRLEATRSYYAYLEKLDLNLSQPWKFPPVDGLRVPLQFKELPAPLPVEGPDGKLEPPAVDPRQPEYAGLELKGLIGAWQAQIGTEQSAFLYAATNHEMFLTEDRDEAHNFTRDLVATMEAALQTTAKVEPDAAFPKGHQFSLKQSFQVYLLNSPLEFRGSRYVFEVYALRQQDNQVALVLATPEGMDPSSKVAERVQLMLESLRVSGAPAQPKQAGQATPTGPAPKTGGF